MLGIVGAAVVFAATVVNFLIVRADSPRYKLDLLNTYRPHICYTPERRYFPSPLLTDIVTDTLI